MGEEEANQDLTWKKEVSQDRQVRNIQLVGSLNWRGAGVSSLEGWLTRSLCVGRAKRERGRPAGASMVFMAVESTW